MRRGGGGNRSRRGGGGRGGRMSGSVRGRGPIRFNPSSGGRGNRRVRVSFVLIKYSNTLSLIKYFCVVLLHHKYDNDKEVEGSLTLYI